MQHRIADRRRPQRGFTYIGVLIAVVVIQIGLTAISEVWVTTVRRQKMEHLVWIEAQFAAALRSYYESSPGLVKHYPQRLEDLLGDARSGAVRRHLREIYASPFSGSADWKVVRDSSLGIFEVRRN